ncbi:hypothetical protein VTN96DRAFT_761 [Rasamsonia emersonii]
MQPRPGLSAAQFHDWYNNEHGPLRLRLPFIPNGFRYRATDGDGDYSESKPEWLAFYDVADSVEFTRPPYTTLREDAVKTPREKDTMAQIAVDRRMYDFIQEWRADDYQPLDRIDASPAGHVLVAVSFYLQDPSQEAELDRWYREEHVNLLSKVPGWRRSRRFVTSSVTNPKPSEKEYLALHEYAPQNGLGGPEFQAATSTPWTQEIYSKVVRDRKRRVYEWHYTFGPAPRDLQPLASPDYAATFTSRDGLTKTFTASQSGTNWPVIESYVTTADGVTIPYRLEGAPDRDAPLIVLSNSILTDWGIWDDFLQAFFAVPQNKVYRVLRYRTRGRNNDGGKLPVTIDLLAQDLITLLDALRVPKAAALIGVSLGGVTVLNTALKYPARVGSFISSDTNAVAPASNPKAWAERIALAEGDTDYPVDAEGARLIGEKLAEATVRRWFVAESFDGGAQEARAAKVKEYVRTNRLDGFKQSVQALYAYDVREQMKSGQVRGIFTVGSGDGILPNTMKEMAASYANGVPLHVIERAGHLPMAEQPEKFAQVVTEFLQGN